MALIVLGVAASVLVLGGVVTTVALWEPAPAGARLALIVLDVALVCFYTAIIVVLYQSLTEHKGRGRRASHSRDNNPLRLPDAQLKIARRLASELDTTLVRRRDGTYYLKVGPVEGRVPTRPGVVRLGDNGADWVEASAYSWLCMLAESLNAELVYDGSSMEWYLCWPDVREAQGDRDDT